MKKSIYVMKCGCEISKDDILFYRGARRCPNHRDCGIKEIRRICVDCHEELIIKPLQTTKIRCDKCNKKLVKTMNASRHKRKKKVEQKMDLSLYTKGLAMYLPCKQV